MLENRHTGISFGHIISTMFTRRIRISRCQHDQGFMDLFTPLAVSQVSSGPHSVDVEGPQKSPESEPKKGPNGWRPTVGLHPLGFIFVDRITAHNSSPLLLQMQSQDQVGYQIFEYTLLSKRLLCLCTIQLAQGHHPFLSQMLVTIWLSYSCPATWYALKTLIHGR